MIKPERLVFIDFEACGLAANSWPIEIGAAWIDEGRIMVADALIRPTAGWDETAWCKVSANVHRISRDELARAASAVEVAERFATLFEGRILISDALDFDRRWLARLMSCLPRFPDLTMGDFDALVSGSVSPAAAKRVAGHLRRTKAPHRAGADAKRLAEAWLAGNRS